MLRSMTDFTFTAKEIEDSELHLPVNAIGHLLPKERGLDNTLQK